VNRLLEAVRVALDSIWSHRLRSGLTLLGVVIGVATIVTVVSVIAGLNRFVREEIFSLSPDVFIVSKFGIIRGRDEFLKALRRKDLSVAEMERVRRLCSSCRNVGATTQGTKSLRRADRRLPDVQITGSTSNLADLYNLDIVEGRFYTESEVTRAAPVAVIGWDVRDQLFPGIDPIGRSLSVEGYPLQIVGVLRRQGSVLGQNQDSIVWIPIELYDKVFGRNRSIDMWIQAQSLGTIEQTQDEVRTLLRHMRGLDPSADDPFGIVTAEALQVLWKGISAAAFAMMVLIAAISLVVGGVVIMNIMLISVAERTHEIGLRAAVGARRRDILLQFLLEASILAAAGGLVGIAIGAGISGLVATLSPLPTLVRPMLVVVALGLATAVGVAAGLFPAWKASRLDPIDALRME
jgi:putative ABC transport system permease protein